MGPVSFAENTRRTTCPLCSNGRLGHAVSKDSFSVDRCSACGTEFLNPQPDDASLAAIYTGTYFLGDDAASREHASRLKTATASLYLDFLCRFLSPARSRLLEIGCGRGELLFEARKRGFEVAGIELSAHAANDANRRLNRPAVRLGALEDVDLPPAHFNAVISADVLEHVRDPLAFLKRVHRVLQPAGFVMLITPSLDGFWRRIMGRHWMEYKLEHLFYFRRTSIRFLLANAGLEVIHLGGGKKALSLDYVHGHFQRFPVPVLSGTIAAAAGLLPQSVVRWPMRVPAGSLVAVAQKPGVAPRGVSDELPDL